MTIEEQIQKMTLEEKASLCSGYDFWRTKPIERLGIPSVVMTDGPHGMRKQPDGDQMGLHGSVPATCFPSGATLASSWNRQLIQDVGAAMAEEAQSEGVSILLGPAVNIKRSPLCGRNFEYLSEDPYLTGQLAKSHILGLQGGGVGASLKHFAANNQERYRMVVDVQVDERTLREIYLAGFETAIGEARPWTVMCAYNRLNGSYCSENEWLLTTVLREEWGYEGIVVTDWGACNDRVAGLRAGQDLEMPASGGINDRAIVQAVESGRLELSILDVVVGRILGLVNRAEENARPGTGYDAEAHHALARRAAGECIVLLKNDENLLPLRPSGRVAVIGALAERPRFQGGGSSHIHPTQLDLPLEEIRRLVGAQGEVVFAPGYSSEGEEPDAPLIEDAVRVAEGAEVAVLFIGLPDEFESEGYDRTHLSLPRSHVELLTAVSRVQQRLVVVLANGSPVEMPWLDKAGAVLDAYLGGQAGGGAVADVLFGLVNPSGRLAETFPVRIEDTPCYLNFPGDRDRVEYREGVFVGYRYYDAVRLEPLFPFGFGLSYTSFEYSDLTLDREAIREHEELTVTLRVSNTGRVTGAEVVQLYVHDEQTTISRPPKELKGFEKVTLAAGESTTVRFALDRRCFAFWDTASGSWRVNDGDYAVLVGASSRDVRLQARVVVQSEPPTRTGYDWNVTLGELYDHPVVGEQAQAWRTEFLAGFTEAGDGTEDDNIGRLMRAMTDELPLRSLALFVDSISHDAVDLFVGVLNGSKSPESLESIEELQV